MAAATERLTALLQSAAPADAELLGRFVRARDQAAFAAIVERHGHWVLGVCRRVAGDADADDVFQAVFVTLSRNAHRLRMPESLPAWLHATAHRLSLNAVRARRRRDSAENRATSKSAVSPLDELSARELLAILDSAIQKLPEQDRSALILCCLDGLSLEEAASRLGVTCGTVKGRLERGRARLRNLLEKQGLAVPTVLGAGLLVASPRAIARPLIDATLAISFGESVPSAAVKALLATAPRRFLPAALLIGAMTAGAGLMTLTKTDVPAQPPPVKPVTPPRVDALGDPLPNGAIARLGTERLRAPDSALVLSEDGKTIVAVSKNLVVREFDAADGLLKSVRRLAKSYSSTICLSPDGRRLLGLIERGDDVHQIAVWDVGNGKRIFSHPCDLPTGIRGAAFTPGAHAAIVLFLDRRGSAICRADFQSGDWKELIRLPFKHPEHIEASPDCRKAVIYSDRTLTCWDLATGTELWRVSNADTFVAFSPDSKTVALNTPGGKTCEFRDAATGKLQPVAQLPQNTRGVSYDPQLANFALKYSHSGRKLLLFDWDKQEIVIWDIAQGKERVRLPAGFVQNRRVAFSRDDSSLITLDNTLQRWDLTTGKSTYGDAEPLGHSKSVDRITYTSNGKRLLSVSADGSARVWDVANGRLLRTWRGHGPQQLSCAAFLPDNRSAVTVGNDGYLRMWDSQTGKELKAVPYVDNKRAQGFATDLVLSPDGKVATVIGCSGGRFQLLHCDLTAGKTIESKPVNELWLAPDGKTASYSALHRDEVHLTNLETGTVSAVLRCGPPAGSRDWPDLRGRDYFSHDSRWFAKLIHRNGRGRDENCFVNVWDTGGGLPLHTIPTQASNYFACAFSHDCRLIAIADSGGIKVWDLAAGRELWREPQSTRTAVSLAFAPDGCTLAAGYDDTTILIWQLPRPERGMPIPASEVRAVWEKLGSSDMKRANAALWRLVDDPASAIRIIRERAAPKPADVGVVRKLIQDLGSADFKTRDAAEQKLKELGRAAEKEIRAATKEAQSAESKRRLLALLERLESDPFNGRMVAVLERIGTPEARKLLESLAAGDSRLAHEAKAAMQRR